MKEWIDKIVNVLLEKKSGNLQKGGTMVLETFLVVVRFWFDFLREDFKRGILLQFSSQILLLSFFPISIFLGCEPGHREYINGNNSSSCN